MAGKFLKYLLIAVVVGNLVIVAIVFLGSTSTPERPIPKPNGYDDFVAAGNLMLTDMSDYRKWNQQELTAAVAQNQEALKLVRTGLGRDCLVPDDYQSPTYLDPSNLARLKRLEFLICAKARLEALDGKTNDAVMTYLDGMRFGQESCRGGVMIFRLVGLACETIARNELVSQSNGVDARQAKVVAHELETMDAKEESIEETFGQEKRWSHANFGLKGQIVAIFTYKQNQQAKDRMSQKVAANTLNRRRVMMAFAAQAYELKKGKQPSAPADLLPEYLKAIPKDPMTGTNISFRQ